MRKLLFTLLILAGSLWACEKESQKEVSPLEQQKSASGRTGVLTSEERAAADAMGRIIPMSEFQKMTKAYQKGISSTDTRAVMYGAPVLEEILSQKGCVGIRFYLAKDAEGRTTVVFIGVDKNGKDINSNAAGRTSDGKGSTGGDGPICPSMCG
ncbi:hypothetical protein [Telluribacter humicola]|uniref:hypothetical protein n=1 Tax=Telluribacter humicola TaxID=1720261 RepID=UPI001A961C56|nr:hypothetical protein [Telluribacter humicola]